MAESSVQNGVSKTSWGDEVSSNSSTNGGSARGDKKNTGIKAHPKSKDTHHTYSVYYYGEEIETTVTHRASVVDNWLDHLLEEFKSRLNNLVVGLDIEWRRLERNNKDSRRRKVAVLQLCVDNHCLIYQFSCCDKKTPESLKKFLADEELIFVGAGIEADAYKLMVDYGLKVARTEDLASFVAFKTGDSRLYKYGLKKLVKDVLKQDLPKSRFVQTSDWELSLLSNKQIEYACLDAVASFKLGVQLMSLGNPRHTYRKQVPPRLRKSNGGKTNGTNNERTN